MCGYQQSKKYCHVRFCGKYIRTDYTYLSFAQCRHSKDFGFPPGECTVPFEKRQCLLDSISFEEKCPACIEAGPIGDKARAYIIDYYKEHGRLPPSEDYMQQDYTQ